MFKKIIFVFILIVILGVIGFLAITYSSPWEMMFDTSNCGESPIGFYRLKVVPFELTDYGGAEVQTGDPLGGVWEFVKFYFGQFDPCR